MFNFLKNKLKSAVSKFTKEVSEDEKEIEEVPEEKEIIEEVKEEISEEKLSEKEIKVDKETDEDEQTEEKLLEKEKEILEEEKEVEEKVEDVVEKEEILEKKPVLENKEVEEPVEIEKEEKSEVKEEENPNDPEKVEEEVKEAVQEEQEKDLEKERVEIEKEVEVVEEKREKKRFFGLFKKKVSDSEKELEEKVVEKEETEKEAVKGEKEEPIVEEKKERKSIFSKVTSPIVTKKIDEHKFEELFWDLELALLENNVAVEIIEKIKEDLKNELVGKPLTRTKVAETINKTLKSSIKEILEVDQINFLDKVKEKLSSENEKGLEKSKTFPRKPYVVCFVGINGSGKTTSIAKVAKLLQNNNISCVMAAADTFRAAAIDQIQHHADKLGIKLIKQDYGSDPAAVAFDAIKHAEAKGIDVVLVDTAGRMHSNVNLQDEMKKIIRVAKPDLKIFVGESITGNDCIEQAKQFNDSIEIDGIILSKADIDEKGGAALSVSYVTKKPIMYIGVGQEYDDLKEFNSEIVLDNLGL
jgi:fused signal recognition particle receptor